MSKSLVSEELRLALLQQYVHEKFNANFYLTLSAFFKNKGLDKFGKLFLEQHDEEVKHSLQIYEFLTDMNADFTTLEIDAVNINTTSILDIANAYLEREVITTKDLEEIKQISIDSEEGVAEEFLRMMINQQRNELAEASTFVDNAELCGNDWWKVKVWNDGLEG